MGQRRRLQTNERAVIRICRRRRWLHVADDAVLDAERGHVDTLKLGIVGRAGANAYVGTTEVIKLALPSVEDLTAG